MNRLSISTFSSVAALLVFLPSSGIAQEKTLKQQIQGPWQQVSCNSTNEKGEKAPYCNNSGGSLILAGNGHFAGVIVASGRKDVNAPGVAATSGTWSVNEATKTLTRRVINSNYPDVEGKDVISNISLNGEEMRLTGDLRTPDGVAHLDGTYRRFK